jgi:competence ComEA-like helix-hairpin-helix protein
MKNGQKRIQAFAFIISICVAFCFACISSANIACLQKTNDKEMQLDNRINPNLAPLESLVRLPNIGISKAEAIISYRENYAEKNNGQSAFETLNDLQNVKGIGRTTAQNLSQWLKFARRPDSHRQMRGRE